MSPRLTNSDMSGADVAEQSGRVLDLVEYHRGAMRVEVVPWAGLRRLRVLARVKRDEPVRRERPLQQGRLADLPRPGDILLHITVN